MKDNIRIVIACVKMKREAKIYLKNIWNYGHFIQTIENSDYKLETIEFTDEHTRQWIFKKKYCKKHNNKLLQIEWKCKYDTFEKKGIIQKK